jgi:hypothetical protein
LLKTGASRNECIAKSIKDVDQRNLFAAVALDGIHAGYPFSGSAPAASGFAGPIDN